MPGDQIPHSVLPLTESGQLNHHASTYSRNCHGHWCWHAAVRWRAEDA